MPVHAFLLHALALVVAIAGIRKVVDPAAVAAALRRSGWPSSPVLGRAIGLVEVAVAVAVLAAGGPVPAAALGAVYLGFLVFIVSNKVRGADTPCGCFGESDTPPGAGHIAVNLVGVATGMAGALDPADGLAGWFDSGIVGLTALALVVVAAVLTITLLEVLPSVASSAAGAHGTPTASTFTLKEPR